MHQLIPSISAQLSDSSPGTALCHLDSLDEGIRRVRQLPEEEVIAQFLKNEFFRREFDLYREHFSEIVWNPDFTSATQNRLRRALLFLRRGRLWRELPTGTEWWEVQLRPELLSRIRVFPRNHWCRFARNGFYLSKMLNRIRRFVELHPSHPFARKLRSLRTTLSSSANRCGSVLLISLTDAGPFTIIEGNHRIAAASLISENAVLSRFRFVCGFSPRMGECCWHRTNFFTLSHYAWNFVTYLMDDHASVLKRELHRPSAVIQAEIPVRKLARNDLRNLNGTSGD